MNVILVMKDTFTTVLRRNVYHVLPVVNHANQVIFLNVLNVSVDIMLVWLMEKIHVRNVLITVQFVTMVLLVLNVAKGFL